MIDIEKIKQAALAVTGWSNCNQAWLDTSEDTAAAVVGHIDEDGNEYQVITVDCDLYFQGQDSLPLAKYYAQANPSAVLELINRLEATEKERDTHCAERKLLSEAFAEQLAKLTAAEQDAAKWREYQNKRAKLLEYGLPNPLRNSVACMKESK